MDQLRVSILQADIAWENKQDNLRRLREKLENLRGAAEIVVLPETFSTGFSMNARQLAEPVTGSTVETLRRWASDYRIALAGSYIACDESPLPPEKGKISSEEKNISSEAISISSEDNSPSCRPAACYNRAFFLTPEGEAYFCDKRHLFRMGNETEHFTAGSRHTLITYRGWNIRLLVCYDLRFPVWSRNVNNEYDLLIYVANWPAARRTAWDVLLQARALENQSYVCGVNRIGTDGNHITYNGGSAVYSPKGERLARVPDREEGTATAVLDLQALQRFRDRFPAWKDADTFTVH